MSVSAVEKKVASNPIKQVWARLSQLILPLGGEFGGSKIVLTPLPEEVRKKSAAEVLVNPSPFPKLER